MCCSEVIVESLIESISARSNEFDTIVSKLKEYVVEQLWLKDYPINIMPAFAVFIFEKDDSIGAAQKLMSSKRDLIDKFRATAEGLQ